MNKLFKALIIILFTIGIPGLLIFPAFTSSLSLSGSAEEFEGQIGMGFTPPPMFTPTATQCPRTTAEPLWVDPVLSPTGNLTQTIVVYIGIGEWARVLHETGVFTQTGDFSAYNNPARISIDLFPNTTHHLIASGRVKVVQVGDCQYGGYTLSTQLDRDGNPLTIMQERHYLNMPFIPNEATLGTN